MVRVKICGITSREDAQKAANLGAWALGFIFHKKSPRYIAPARAKKIIQDLPPFVSPVGVFVNHPMGAIRDIISHCGLRVVQLHGDEDHHYCHRLRRYNVKIIKAFRITEDFDFKKALEYHVDAYLFDTFQEGVLGGTGKTFNWNILQEFKSANRPFIVSGGLNPQNVIEVVNTLKPYAVDASSGLEESPGKKSHQRLKEFIDIVHYISGPAVKQS